MYAEFSYQHYLHEVERLGYINVAAKQGFAIVGWRNKFSPIDSFSCKIGVYQEGKEPLLWNATTFPGKVYMNTPLLKKGTAILVPGQYLNSHSLGIYKGYTALRQWGPVEVYRDSDGDNVRDYRAKDYGLFGIHIHRAGKFSNLVGNWSAGCQVFQKKDDFDTFISICQKHRDALANMFTYTLLEF